MTNAIRTIGLVFVSVWLAGCNSNIDLNVNNNNQSSNSQRTSLDQTSLQLSTTAQVFNEQRFTERAYVAIGRTRAGSVGASSTSYNGYQYAIYYEQTKIADNQPEQVVDVIVARRHIASGNIEKVSLATERFTEKFAHNRLNIAISRSDGSVHAIFSHPNKKQFRYAKSIPNVGIRPLFYPWKTSLFEHLPNFGESELPGIDVSYPHFNEMPSGDLLIYFRSGGAYAGEMRFATYSGDNHMWSPIRKLTSRYGTFRENEGTRGPYVSDGIHGDNARNLRLTWLFRETSGGCDVDNRKSESETFCNHGLFFAQSRDNGLTWLSHDNRLLADLPKGEPISVEKAFPPPVELPPELAPSNVANNAAIDPVTGDFHILISQLENRGDKDKIVFHYLSDTDGNWIGRRSSFSADDVKIAFIGDYMLAFGARLGVFIQYSLRDERFENWYTIPIMYNGQKFNALGGNAKWDFGRLHEGVASLIWQKPVTPNGSNNSSPVEVYDIRFAESRYQ